MHHDPTESADALRATPMAAPADAPPPVIIRSDGTTRTPHFVTEGEKKFDRLTYNRIGYIANALISVASVYWAERSHSGQKTLSAFGEWAGKFKGINGDKAKYLLTKTFFLTGGFLVLPPMKWLEDHKLEKIRAWNEQIYGAEKLDSDPVLVQSARELERAPKQTWASMLSSRVLALLPFYATVGLLWNNNSVLARNTAPELRKLSKEAINTLERTDASAYSQIASKGIYFDRPIAFVSRTLGKGWAKLTGNAEALTRLGEMETRYPGMIKHGGLSKLDRDPMHSTLPYYFISEAITSGMVAWGVYVLTRITAVLFHNKPHAPLTEQPTSKRADVEPAPAMSAANISPPSREEAPDHSVQQVQHVGALSAHTPAHTPAMG